MPWNTASKQRALAARDWWRKHWFGVSGSWSAAWSEYIGRDPMMRNVFMVVELIFGGGKRIRIATVPLSFDFTDLEGNVTERIAVLPLLKAEPEISTAYRFGSGASGARSFGIDLSAEAFDSDEAARWGPWKLIMQHQRFLAGFAEVVLIGRGMDWSERFVLMRGSMTGGISFGAAREGISVKISDPKLTSDLGITEYVTNTDRFPTLPDEFVGMRFPLVFNDPRYVPAIRVTPNDTTPTWLVAYGHSNLSIGSVYVDGELKSSGSADFPWSEQKLFDELGTPYTAVVFSGGSGTFEDTTSVNVNFQATFDMLNVVDVIQRLAEEWSLLGPVGVSHEAFGRARSMARQGATDSPGIFINGSGDSDATRALEFIESTICASFPMISMAWLPGGYGPILTDRRTEAVAKWIVGSGDLFKRETDWEETPKEALFNWYTLRYEWNPMTSSFESVQLRNPNNSLLCQISEEQAGPLDFGVMESVLIYDETLAVWTIDWLTAHYSIPSYYAEYVGPPTILIKYRLGQNIDLVDSEIWGCDTDNPIRATIEKISYVRGKCTVGLRLWPLLAKIPSAGIDGAES